MTGPAPEQPVADELTALVAELEDAAAGLRAGEVEGADAAAVVERCAELAGRIAAELDRRAREASAEEPPGQEKLL